VLLSELNANKESAIKSHVIQIRKILQLVRRWCIVSWCEILIKCPEISIRRTDLVMEINVCTSIQKETDHGGVAFTGGDN
jgi:hypothetical protein